MMKVWWACKAGYYELRGGGLGGATFVLLKLMGPPIDRHSLPAATPEKRKRPPGDASTFNYTLLWLPEHLQLHLTMASNELWVVSTFSAFHLLGVLYYLQFFMNCLLLC